MLLAKEFASQSDFVKLDYGHKVFSSLFERRISDSPFAHVLFTACIKRCAEGRTLVDVRWPLFIGLVEVCICFLSRLQILWSGFQL